MIETIKEIARLPAKYITHLIGDQKQIEDTPFEVQAGKLTTSGKVENAASAYKVLFAGVVTLIAATNNQKIFTEPNDRYNKLALYIRQATSITSYDWKLVARPRSIAQGDYPFFDRTFSGGHWYKAGIADANYYCAYGDLPYGDILLHLKADNNHATDPIPLTVEAVLFDPVR